MSILKFFSGPSPDKLEEKGDALFEAGIWGQARQAYDRALQKLERQTTDSGEDQARVTDKYRRSGEALAQEHIQRAEGYLEGGHIEEAKEMLTLALEITTDDDLMDQLEDRIHQIAPPPAFEAGEMPLEYQYPPEEADFYTKETSDDDYFSALCGTLPEEVQDIYFDYGKDFKSGYIALNRGDFQKAEDDLTRALEQNPGPDSYIPLELAAVHLNLGRLNEAQGLLENFLPRHPDALPAYRLLCEVYWEQNDFSRADALLLSVAEDLANSLAFVHLKGETYRRSGNPEGARDHYIASLDSYGWNDTVASELAGIYESLNENEPARKIYQEIMGRCNSCHARIDPVIKHRYAELCFADGIIGSDILEIYLSLAREIPHNAAAYFDRISRIYTAQGNPEEANRFRSFAARAEAELDESDG